MKKIYALIFIASIASNAFSQNVGINTTGAAPDASSMLDIVSSSSGVLIPRVALTATNATGPITTPATSLLVYNTATAGTAPNNVVPGYYYNSGTPAAPSWRRVATGNGDAWLTTGNAGTSVATNFLGTIDNVDFAIRTNNTERARVLSTGNVGIGITAPTQRLDVQGGNARINNTFIGDVGHGANWGGWSHSSQNNTTGYGLLQSSDGAFTLINKQNTGTGYIGFRVGNTDQMVVLNNGNVGIATSAPVSRLQVVGKSTFSRDGSGECCGNNATIAIADNPGSTGRASISFHNSGEAEGTMQLIQNNYNGILSRRIQLFDNQAQGMGLELTGRLWYGSAGVRTETRDNAGLQGNAGAQSGFFETSNPTNYPAGASSWWHLIDVRHSNNGNNFAMQLAGSFFDQRLFFRKTNNNAAQAWTEVLTNSSTNSNGVIKLFSTLSWSGVWASGTSLTFIITAPLIIDATGCSVSITGPNSALYPGMLIRNVVAEAGQVRITVTNGNTVGITGGIPIALMLFY